MSGVADIAIMICANLRNSMQPERSGVNLRA